MRTDIPTMSVHLEDRFQGRCFTHDLLHRLKKQHLAAKFGPGGHDLTDLFKKGELIRQLGGSFVVIPSKTDLGVKSIHCQKKLMAQYARLYGDFKMADGTHKLSQYEYVFVFFMVIDCLLKSKFVGYTIIFAENTESIIEGAEIFFPHECAPMKDNKLYVGKLDGHFDPFVDREIDLSSPDKSPVEPNWSVQSPVDAPGTVPMSISSSGESGTVAATANTNLVPVVPEKLPSNDNGSNESRQSIATGASGVKMEYGKDACSTSNSSQHQYAFMTDEGNAFPGVAEHFGWTHLLDRKHFSEQITQSWGGLDDPRQYREDMYRILDEVSSEKLDERFAAARSLYNTPAAHKFIEKLHHLRHKLCYAYFVCMFSKFLSLLNSFIQLSSVPWLITRCAISPRSRSSTHSPRMIEMPYWGSNSAPGHWSNNATVFVGGRLLV